MTIELKPCPFCGGVGEIVANASGDWVARCVDCAATGGWSNHQPVAARFWNMRSLAVAVDGAKETLDRSIRDLYAQRRPLTRAARLGTLSCSDTTRLHAIDRLRAIEVDIDALEAAERALAAALAATLVTLKDHPPSKDRT